MKRNVIAFATLLGFALTLGAQRTPTPEAQLGAIINLAEGEGKYDAAIPLYKKFIAENGKNKALAARAQYHLAVAYEKLGKPEARQAFEQLTREYPNDPLAEEAKRRLAALGGASGSAALATRLIASPMSASSVSADGRLLAFSEGVAGGIAVHDTTTRQVTRPTAAQTKSWDERSGTAEFPLGALISPDGRHLIYGWQLQTPGPATAKNEFQLRIISNQVNGQPRTLVDFGGSAYYILPSAWAPDGKSVLVTIIKQDDQTWQIARAPVSDGKLEILKSLGWRAGNGLEIKPTFSPDGKYIAYAARAGNPGRDGGSPEDPTHIYILPANGIGAEVELVKGSALNESPVWTPDGKTILFVSNRGGDFGLWSVAIQDGKPDGNPRLVKPDTGRISPVGVTRSGAYYYRTPRMTADKVFLVDTAARNTAPSRREPETIFGRSPSWSQDGKQVALIREDKPVSSARIVDRFDNVSVVVYSIETQDEKRYPLKNLRILQKIPASTPAGRRFVPSDLLWLHDGKSILFFGTDAQGNNALFQIHLKAEEIRQLAPAPHWFTEARVVLSPDDKTLYLLQGIFGGRGRGAQVSAARESGEQATLASIDLATGRQTTISMIPKARTDSMQMALSSDNRTMALIGRDAIITVNLDNGQQKTIFEGAITDPVLSSDSRMVLWRSCSAPRGCDRILAMDLGTGQQRRIVALQAPEVVNSFALSRNGQAVAFTISRGGTPQLATVGLDGSEYRTLKTPPEAAALQVLFVTNDASAVLVRAGRNFAPAGQSLIRVPASGGEPQVVLEIGRQPPAERNAHLNPAGSHMAVYYNEQIDEGVWTLDNISAYLKTVR